jgi:acylphosphatase
MPVKQLHIKGKVQGVFYRASAKEMADKIGLKGWIRNKKDGSVEACITGSEESVENFIVWCKKGPKGAIVTAVDIVDKESPEHFDSFTIMRG